MKTVLYIFYLLLLCYGTLLVSEALLGFVWHTERVALDSSGYRAEEGLLPRHFKGFVVQKEKRPALPETSYTYSLYGCRHPGELNAVKLRQGAIKTLFLGDSFTLGWGVGDKETIPYFFADAAGELDSTLNCGMYGGGTAQHMERLRRVLKNEPELSTIYYQVFGNDVLQDLSAVIPERGSATQASPTTVEETAGQHGRLMKFLNDHYPRTTNILLKGIYNKLRTLTGSTRNYLTRRDHIFSEYGAILKEDILTEEDAKLRQVLRGVYKERISALVSEARAENVSMRAYLVPYGEVIEPATAKTKFVDLSKDADEESVLAFRRFVQEVFSEANVPFLDLHDCFLEAKKARPGVQLYIPHDLHLTPQGTTIAAECLAEGFRAAKTAQP